MKKWLVLICAVMMLMSTAMAEKSKRYNPGEYNMHVTTIRDLDSEFAAGSEYCPGNCYIYVLLNDGTAEIVGVFRVSGDIKLPSDLNGYTVTSIGKESFWGNSPQAKPTSIVIPDSVTYISEHAFWECYATNIFLPSSVTYIGPFAFQSCWNLTGIVIPDSVTAIYDGTFASCYDLQSVTIPDSVTSIGEGAFAYCTALTSIIIPENVTSIGDRAFEACTALTSVVVPESVTSIGDWVFLGCTSLTTLTVTPGSYAEQYAIDHNIPYVYAAEATPAPAVEEGEIVPPDTFWTCTCGSLNDYNFCPECGSARPVVEPTCTNCGYDPEGETPNFCPACGTRF